MIREIDLDKIYEVVLESAESPIETCLYDLRDELNEHGFELPKRRKGEKKAYVEAMKYWPDIKEKQTPLKDIPVIELDDLPSTLIEKNGTEYYIHGVMHIPQADDVNDFFRDKVSEYDENGICLYEQNLNYVFDIEDIAHEIDDHCVHTFMDKRRAKRGKLPNPYPLSEIHDEFLEAEMLLYAIAASDDIKYLPLCREYLSRISLPEPLWMNYLSWDGARTRMLTKRSKYMADKMEEYGKDYDEVHIITGYSHEPQIEYFLEESDFI